MSEIKLVEAEVQKINLQKNDILVIKIKQKIDFAMARSFEKQCNKIFAPNKVAVLMLENGIDIDFSIVGRPEDGSKQSGS